jgi:DNA-binding NarL/FixJ family response regulator
VNGVTTGSAAKPAAIRVFILGDHEIVRRGLTDVLRSDGMHVVGEAARVAEALRRIPAARPHVVMIELSSGESDGIAGCAEITAHSKTVRCVVLGWTEDHAVLKAAAAAGATGYLPMRSRAAEILQCIRRVASGSNVLEQALVAERSARTSKHRATSRQNHTKSSPASVQRAAGSADLAAVVLTVRQRDILQRLAVGMTNREIAQDLSLAEKTIANNISGLMVILGVQRRTQAAVLGATLRSLGAGESADTSPPHSYS